MDMCLDCMWLHRWFICQKLLNCAELPRWLSSKEFTCQAGDMDSIARLGRFLGEGSGSLLQYSCLGNPMDRGACGQQSLGSKSQSMTQQLNKCNWTVHMRGTLTVCKSYFNKVILKSKNYKTKNDESEYIQINYYCSTKDTRKEINRTPWIRWVTDWEKHFGVKIDRLISRKIKESINFANQHYKWETQFKNGRCIKLHSHRKFKYPRNI